MDEESLCDEAGIETSGDDADFNIEIESTSTSQLHVYEDEYQYEVLSISDIVAFMTECINAVNTVIHIPSPTIRILLNHYNWDKEKLVEHFFDRDQEALFREANVVNPLASNKSAIAIATVNNSASATINTNMTGGGNKKGILTNKNTIGKSVVAPAQLKMKLSRNVLQSSEECSICFASCLPEQMAGLECGHRFCLQCWNEYLTTKIMEEGVGQTIACAAHKCPILVDDQTVMTLVRDARVKTKYQHLITNSFVECNRLMRWCPAPDCNYAVRVAYVDAKPVACACGHVFCFACGENWHDPVKCNLLKKWMKKFDDDSETSNWISANTKECPKCNATIEKDGGCNHMVCKNQNCKADFCWVCLGSWEPHGSSWYHCNRYDESEAKAARDAQDRSRAALQRYLFYCNRYMNHMQSLKFEHKLYSAVKDKMEEMQQQNMSWIEVQFLRKAVDTLCKCRQTLMYTYVFAYYLEKNNQSVIFEDNQKDLESATEILSEYLERDITSENIVDIKQKVQDKYRYCDGRRKALLDHVHEGYEKDWWVCNNL